MEEEGGKERKKGRRALFCLQLRCGAMRDAVGPASLHNRSMITWCFLHTDRQNRTGQGCAVHGPRLHCVACGMCAADVDVNVLAAAYMCEDGIVD